jgi:hypothetical protein
MGGLEEVLNGEEYDKGRMQRGFFNRISLPLPFTNIPLTLHREETQDNSK